MKKFPLPKSIAGLINFYRDVLCPIQQVHNKKYSTYVKILENEINKRLNELLLWLKSF